MKIGFPKRKVIFQPSFFRGYVSFREGKLLMLVVYPIMYNRFFTSQVVSRISEPSTVSPRKIRKCLDMKKKGKIAHICHINPTTSETSSIK